MMLVYKEDFLNLVNYIKSRVFIFICVFMLTLVRVRLSKEYGVSRSVGIGAVRHRRKHMKKRKNVMRQNRPGSIFVLD